MCVTNSELPDSAALADQVCRLNATIEVSRQNRITTLGELQAMVQSISKIAVTMKRLTINGSIEAARVGETGAGFAVIVVEMRALADAAHAAAQQAAELMDRRARDRS